MKSEELLDNVIVIYGRKSLQNAMLARLLANNLSCRAVLADALSEIREVRSRSCAAKLTLVDVIEVKLSDIWDHRSDFSNIALVNIDKDDRSWEVFIEWPELRGAFYADSGQDALIRGISAIFSGEVWLPRRLLSDYLDKSRSSEPCKSPNPENLTRREIEIIQLLAGGRTNAEIADSLCLSTHTVKTHIYNLFRKINASNRIHAINWAKQRALV